MLKKILFLSLLILLIFSVKSYAHPYSVNECYDHISAQAFKTARSWGIRAVDNHPKSFYAHLCLYTAPIVKTSFLVFLFLLIHIYLYSLSGGQGDVPPAFSSSYSCRFFKIFVIDL